MARLKFIVEPLPEWRNTFNRGFQCELWAREALEKQSLQILFHHCKCAHIEIDLLVFRKPNEVWIVEVKSNGHEEFQGARLQFKQKLRLERVALQIINVGIDVRVVLALVSTAEEIQWLDVFSCEPIEF